MNQSRARRAFTLVELMVVVAIIGILATVVVVNVVGQTYEAKKTRVKADFASIKNAVRMFKIQNGSYPRSLDELLQPGRGGKPSALEELPPDPWDNPYEYEYRSGGKYLITSFGGDGQPGGEEEDMDLDSDTINNVDR
jgi:general secretion pathway protein G